MGKEKKEEFALRDLENPDAPASGKAKPTPEKKKRVSLFTLYRFTSPFERFMLFLGVVGGLVHGVGHPIFVQIFGNVIDSFPPSNGTSFDPSQISPDDPLYQKILDQINGLVLSLVYLAVSNLISSYFQVAMPTLVGNSQTNRIRQEYLTAIMRQEVGWFDQRTSGELTARFSSDIPLIRDGISERFGSLFQCLSQFTAGIIISFHASWKISLVTLATLPILISATAVVGKVLVVYSSKGQKAYTKAGGIAQEVISSIKTVMIFAGYAEDEERFQKALKDTSASGKKRSYMEALALSMAYIILFGIFALSFWYGSTLVNVREISAGKVLISFMGVIFGGMGLGMMVPNVVAISLACGAGYEIFQVIDRKSEIDNLSPSGKKPEGCSGHIAFKGIKFAYPTRPEAEVLRSVSFEVPSGKTVALVGKSGSGKSTTVGLLERFYNPKEGSVTIDGIDIRDLNISWLRSKIGHVGQEPVLFVGTIAENIGLGKENATMEEIIEASKLANAYDFISQLPEGFNTMVQARGQNLSGGQKQRIAIARALIKSPQILLLDEATSALDSKSERIVQEALEKAQVGRSTLVVAHRLSTIRNSDMILVFDQGQIIEVGNHDTLMAKGGEYAKLVELQSLNSKGNSKETEETDTSGNKAEGTEEIIDIQVGQANKDTQQVRKMSAINRMYAEHWKTQWRRMVPGLLFAIGSGAGMPIFGFAFMKILMILVQETGEKLRQDTEMWCGILVAIGFGSTLFNFLQSLSFLHSAEEFMTHLRMKLFSNIIRQKAAFFDEKGHEPAVFANTLAQEIPLLPKATGKLVGSVTKVLACIGVSLGLAFNATWKLALVMAVCVPLHSAGSYLKVRSFKQFAISTRKAYEKSGVVASEAVENIRTVFSLSLEQRFLGRYSQEILMPELEGRKDSHIGGFGLGYGESIQNLIFALSFWYGTQLIASGEAKVEDAFLCIMLVILLGMMIGEYLNIFSDYQQAALSSKEIFKLLDSPKEYDETMMKGDRLDNLEGNIEFKDVLFAYPARSHHQVLRGFNLSVRSGQTVALVGHSGCGKSTTISLIEKLYEYTGGSIKIDGAELSNLHTGWFRSKIGYVGQEPVMFARTIKENILYGFEASDEQVIAAAKKANAHEFISQMTDGYNTYVGERGGQLSGGQKQRIAIARALVRDPKILLLDEATSALDSESEKLVQGAINEARKGRTTLVIAHRLSTIKDADVIVVVNKGRVEEIGDHASLLEKGGSYFHFVQSQSLDAQDL